MRFSVKIGRVFGISLRIHLTFLLLLVFIYISVAASHGGAAAARAVLFISAIFACVLIHELGHSLIARRFGRGATSITLLPIGGIASMEEIPEKPGQEIAMAAIGPFINVAIAGVIYLFIRRWTGLTIANLYPDSAGAFFGALVSVNVLLAIFNLIPAFPMDGGRIFRGLLALRMSYVRATNLAVAVGQALSVLFIFYGLFFNWWLALIGVFLYIGAGGERQHTLIRSVLREIPASRAMVTDFYRLAPGELLSRALEHVYHGYQDDFPVVNGDGIQGVLTRSNILSAIHERGVDVPVEEIMDREFVSIGGEQSMDEVYRELVSKRKTAAVVLENGRLKGMLGLDGISRYFLIRVALSNEGIG